MFERPRRFELGAVGTSDESGTPFFMLQLLYTTSGRHKFPPEFLSPRDLQLPRRAELQNSSMRCCADSAFFQSLTAWLDVDGAKAAAFAVEGYST